MDQDKKCESLIEQYYARIIRYSKSRLQGDVYAAEECTQEVFLLFLEKKDELDLSGNIQGWLYAAADRVILSYKRKKKIRQMIESESFEASFSIPDPSIAEQQISCFDVLTDEELSLLRRYYETDCKCELAQELGITVNALYQRIFVIKKKVKKDKNSF